MADLYNSDLGSNARKAQPTSNFGTRKLQFLTLSVTNFNLFTNDSTGSFADSDSLYSQLVRQIQKVSELYYLGQPTQNVSTNSFVFAIADTTSNWYYSDGVNDYPEQDNDNYNNRNNETFNTLVDQLGNFFSNGSGTDYSDNIWNLAPLVDTGFGLMPGESLNYLQR